MLLENTNSDLLISIETLCEQLQIGTTTAYKLLQTGEIKSFKIGRVYKIPQSSVYEYIESKCNQSPKQSQ